MTKLCKTCGQALPLADFGVRRMRGRRYPRTRCKACEREHRRAYFAARYERSNG